MLLGVDSILESWVLFRYHCFLFTYSKTFVLEKRRGAWKFSGIFVYIRSKSKIFFGNTDSRNTSPRISSQFFWG